MMALMIIIAQCDLVTLVTAGHSWSHLVTAGHIGHCQGQEPQQ